MNQPRNTEYFTPDEVAEKLSISRRTVYAWINSGRLSAVRLSHNLLRIPVASYEALVGVDNGR